MNKSMRNLLLSTLLLTATLSTGCTTKAWYQGVQATADLNCRKQPVTEVERCRERTNTLSYEEYQKVRKGEDK
ncbi:MAG: hypothetical protein QM808_03020 [Steroidobacteraceae bacterium]